MDPLQFVEQHGVVLEGGRGPRPNLAEAITGEPMRGNWWGHKKGRLIFAATRAVRDCDQVLVCRLVDGKITCIHRRLWPAIVCLANSLDKKTLAAVQEEHSPSGAHRVRTVRFRGGFHLKSAVRPRISRKRRPVFNWVNGLRRICAKKSSKT